MQPDLDDFAFRTVSDHFGQGRTRSDKVGPFRTGSSPRHSGQVKVAVIEFQAVVRGRGSQWIHLTRVTFFSGSNPLILFWAGGPAQICR